MKLLDRALLTDHEMALGQEGWNRFKDPFAHWKTIEEIEGNDPQGQPASAGEDGLTLRQQTL